VILCGIMWPALLNLFIIIQFFKTKTNVVRLMLSVGAVMYLYLYKLKGFATASTQTGQISRHFLCHKINCWSVDDKSMI